MSPEHRIRTTLRARPLLADALLALALFGTEAALWLLAPPEVRQGSWMLAAAYSVLGLSAVVIRRRFLWAAVGLLTAQTVMALLAPDVIAAEWAAIIVVTYTAAANLAIRLATLAAALLWVPPFVLTALFFDKFPQGTPRVTTQFVLVQLVLVALVCFLIGRTVHHRRAYMAALEERAHAAEDRQRELTAQAVGEERQRIARELHDVVAHHVSVMGVLATGSRRALRRDPDAADEALATIEETGRTALREMRRLIDVMRTTEDPTDDLAPQPGVSGIAGLVEQVSEAGLPVRLTVRGEPGSLDPGVGLTVYRIVQEALTNALKHAGTATADVRLDFGRYRVQVEVCDTGRGAQPGGSAFGHGLLGMRERVALYGGTLRTGPRPGGGFRVRAEIPTEAAGASDAEGSTR